MTTMNAKNIEYNEERLVELVLYIGAICGLDEHYGVLKLNKILFYSDFLAFKTRGKPITGVKYKKYTHGPAPSVMKELRHRLEAKGEAFDYRKFFESFNGEQMSERRLLPMRKANIDAVLHPEEIAIVDRVMETLRPMTGAAVSRKSHNHPGWRLAPMEETIPYVAALLPEDGPEPLSAANQRTAKRIATEYSSAS